jgi:phosphoglycerate dehydrogenase-like enzyme
MTKEGEDMESERPATDRTGTIGIIGAGNIGQALARTALRAGREVVIANSRGPESLAPGGGRSRHRSVGWHGP